MACNPNCSLNTNGCTFCGNGAIEPGEACDGMNLGGKTCQSQGFAGGSLSCNPNCSLNTSGCTLCGNGQIDPGEACDGMNLGGKTCQSQGFGSGTLTCNANCSLNTTSCSLCGNGIVDVGENCDDSNTVSGDGCSSTCQLEINMCDPDGTYLIQGAPVNYTCCFGLVSVSVNSFIFSNNGATIASSPSNPTTMIGNATTCPSGSFNNQATIAGGCAETYHLSGSFTNANTWTGTYELKFAGPDCDCFGGIGAPCVNQAYTITATR